MQLSFVQRMTVHQAHDLLLSLGCHPSGATLMAPKAIHLCIRIDDLLPQAANILKQEMLAKGGEVAVPSSALRLSSGRISCIVFGTLSQLERLASALEEQPFELPDLASRLRLLCALTGSRPSWLPCETGEANVGGLIDCDIQTTGVYDIVANSIAHAWSLMEQRCSFLVVEGSAESIVSRVVALLDHKASCPVAIWIHGTAPLAMETTTPLLLEPGNQHPSVFPVDAPVFAICKDSDPIGFLLALSSDSVDMERLFVTFTASTATKPAALPRLDCVIMREIDIAQISVATQASALACFMELGAQAIITDCPSRIHQLLTAIRENPWRS